MWGRKKLTEFTDVVRVTKPLGMYVCLDSFKIYINEKEVERVDFDIEKIRAYYIELLANRERAVNEALLTRDAKAQERFEQEKARILEEVETELIAEAEEPYRHDIELCEKFIVVEEKNEEQEAE